MFKNDSINLTYKSPQLPETSDKSKGGGLNKISVVMSRYRRTTNLLRLGPSLKIR